jgi:hypothetical protein
MKNSVINIQQKIKDRELLLDEKMIDVSTICNNSINILKTIINESKESKNLLKIKMMLKIVSDRIEILNNRI